MEKISSFVGRLVHEEDGASASEYAVLVAIIIVAVAAAVSLFDLGNIFTAAGDKVKNCINAVNGVC